MIANMWSNAMKWFWEEKNKVWQREEERDTGGCLGCEEVFSAGEDVDDKTRWENWEPERCISTQVFLKSCCHAYSFGLIRSSFDVSVSEMSASILHVTAAPENPKNTLSTLFIWTVSSVKKINLKCNFSMLLATNKTWPQIYCTDKTKTIDMIRHY